MRKMASSRGYLEFVLEQLAELDGITYRSMMGEYILYFRGKIAAYICDDRLLVKPVKAAITLMQDAPYEVPYEGAKEMILVKNADDREYLKELFEAMYSALPEPKKKKGK